MSINQPSLNKPGFSVKPGQLYLVIAILLAIITVLFFNGFINNLKQKEQASIVATRPVVVAAGPIAPGDMITASNLKLVDWPTESLPPEAAFSSVQELNGRVAKTAIFPNEPVYHNRLADEGSRGGLPVVIPEGKRAITIAVSEVKGVAGFVKPGDRVDILSTFEQPGSTSGIQLTRTVLQNVLVIASAQETAPDAVAAGETKVVEKGGNTPAPKEISSARVVSSVTFALSPEEAERLALADETGSIRLVLRPEDDHNTASLRGVSSNELLSGRGRTATRSRSAGSTVSTPSEKPTQVVELIQGGKGDRTLLEF